MPQPTARLGFTTTDLSTNHVPVGQSIRYAFCPPTSGDHYNDTRVNAPMRPAVYPPTQEWAPGYWIHDLEHGYIVLAYRCPSGVIGEGDCISQAELNQLQTWFDQAPEPPSGVCAKKAVVVRFDSMSTRFALLAWNRALLVNQFDLPTALTFAQQWTDHPSVPEPNAC